MATTISFAAIREKVPSRDHFAGNGAFEMGFSRLAVVAIFASLMFSPPVSATVFDVSAPDNSGLGTLTGTITIDTTAGVVTAADLTFPGAYVDGTVLGTASQYSGGFQVNAFGGDFSGTGFGDDYILDLAGSPVGYQGGTVQQFFIDQAAGLAFFPLANGEPDTGSITPEVSATPLPPALPLFAGGLAALELLGWIRRRKRGHLALAT